ncbi:phosphomannose isomerase type II C-terminal cupin domain [Planktothrix sp. FACHB-1355]|uniref:Phosphomannose isomerase type II C-terminal cupin domain n=1 Tax=Aerosakkonema funiforme FACHB-1375 TaxID=2949571 RepID=A0A926VGP0_9CYAN|nr:MULTISPECIES: phosphomannose isomerase type II C-terminal cupin domain [Oscillatoriales]MBD2182457.1 phosphomannose isomerase type II C-terminal cupin domain [Aerosakkonema funiforme FACHB-1375]MBD3562726.1 phosphomannose isomerase type II C-terminal cupin domain [Planktothrix sp. FACHB-1355]
MPENQNDEQTMTATLNSEPAKTRIRPWGTVTILEEAERYRINRIEVKPGHHISTQMHYHRSEHWVVVSGTAKVICDGKETLLKQKESTYVPMSMPHRVENPGVIPLVMIEVQNGEYLGEDDIIRFGDDTEN